MSAIQRELIDATGVKPVAGETRAAFHDRMIAGIKALSQEAWDALSDEAVNWNNDAVDQKNANVKNPKAAKPIPEFADYKEAAAEESAPRRRRSAEPEPEPEPEQGSAEPQIGDRVTVTSKRGKEYVGELIEMDDKLIVVKADDGGEDEIPAAGATVVVEGGAAGDDGPVEGGEPEFDAGDEVTVVTGRGKTVEGKIVEITDDLVVIDDGQGELEISRETMKSMVHKGGKPAAEAEPPATRSRARASASDAKGADKGKDAGEAADKKRSSNPRGMSVGGRCRELLAENLSMSKDDVIKTMRKEGLEFRDTSIDMIYKDTTTFIELLRAAKKLK